MYNDYFQIMLGVILECAIPLKMIKPVQRRILQSMFGMDDGRFHKVQRNWKYHAIPPIW